MNDLISVIVPIFNVEQYLEKCVQSIINQTYPNLQIILVDDGSTDNSASLCDYFRTQDKRIEVIHKANGGLSDARNAGIDIANGKYVMFVDSDDYLELDAAESMYNAAIDTCSQISICNMMRIYDDGTQDSFYEPVKHTQVFSGNERFSSLMQPSVCNKLFLLDLFKKIRFPKGKFYEDTFVYHELLYSAQTIVFTGKTGYWYLCRKGSILGRPQFTPRYFDFLEAVALRMHFLIEHNIAQYGKEACLSYYAAFSNACRYIKNTPETNTSFDVAKKEYEFVYNTLMPLSEVSIKQKMRLFLLKYCPGIHNRLYK